MRKIARLTLMTLLAVLMTADTSSAAGGAAQKLPRPNGCPSNKAAYRLHRHPAHPDFTVLVYNKSANELALNATPTVGTNNVSSSSPWTEYIHPVPNGCALRNTPDVVVDKDRNIHVATAVSDAVHGTWPGGIFLSTSTDNGKSYSSVQCIAKNKDYLGDKVNSQPALAIDTNSKSKCYNQAYLVWLQYEQGKYKLMFARSFDGGNTFSEPFQPLAYIKEWSRPGNLKISVRRENDDPEDFSKVTVEWTESPPTKAPSSPMAGYCTSIDGGETFDSPTVQ